MAESRRGIQSMQILERMPGANAAHMACYLGKRCVEFRSCRAVALLGAAAAGDMQDGSSGGVGPQMHGLGRTDRRYGRDPRKHAYGCECNITFRHPWSLPWLPRLCAD